MITNKLRLATSIAIGAISGLSIFAIFLYLTNSSEIKMRAVEPVPVKPEVSESEVQKTKEEIIAVALAIPQPKSMDELIQNLSIKGFKVFRNKKSDNLSTLRVEGPEYEKAINAFVSWSYRPVWIADYLMPEQKLLVAEAFFEAKPPIGQWEKLEETAPMLKALTIKVIEERKKR